MVLQDDLATLTAPTGATVVTTTDPAQAARVLGDRVLTADGERLVVRGSDPAEVNTALVGAGVPVTGLVLQRPTLEEVVLAAATGSGDRVAA